jgi:hypothetical protein
MVLVSGFASIKIYRNYCNTLERTADSAAHRKFTGKGKNDFIILARFGQRRVYNSFINLFENFQIRPK